MKYAIAILTLTFTLSLTALAGASNKTTSGIYLIAADFTNGKLTYEGRDGDSSHKVQLRNNAYLEVTHDNKFTRLSKSDIYGFRDSHGRSYRFVGNDAYEIREAGPLFIYKTEHLVPGRKGSSVVEAVYFFSTAASQPVVPLTVANLKNAVPEDHRFQESLDVAFRNDSDLIRFDKSHNTYAVNQLLHAATLPIAEVKSEKQPMPHTMANCTEHCQTSGCAC